MLEKMKPKVYVETSVIGAYFDEREDAVSKAQYLWTRLWWDELKTGYDVVISQAVVDELEHPSFQASSDALELLRNIVKVEIEPDIKLIVQVYVDNQLMPRNPMGDALHLAIAFYHKSNAIIS